jgi:hypothetical protein
MPIDLSALASLAPLAGQLKSAFEVAATALDTKDTVKLQALMHTLYKEISGAQASMLTAQDVALKMQARIQELEKEVEAYNDWKAEATRYQLTDFGENTFAYKLRREAANGEPEHLLCVGCYNKRTKGFLQFEGNYGRKRYVCMNCDKPSELGPYKSIY